MFECATDVYLFDRNALNAKQQLKKMAVVIIWFAKIHIVKLNSAGFALDNGNLMELHGMHIFFFYYTHHLSILILVTMVVQLMYDK